MVDIVRPLYDGIWAEAGEKVTPGTAKIGSGWVTEMMPYQWENWIQNRQDLAISYMFQKGVPEWSDTQEYIANKSVVLYQTNLFIATTTSTGIVPTNTSNWRRLNPTLNSNGVVPISSGGTGATTATAARTALGIGTGATLPIEQIVQQTGYTGAAKIPSGSTAQRPASPEVGYTRTNTTIGKLEFWDGLNWTPVGSGTNDEAPVLLSNRIISSVYTLPVTKNAISAGPVEVTSGGAVLVSDPGQAWVVV